MRFNTDDHDWMKELHESNEASADLQKTEESHCLGQVNEGTPGMIG